MKSSQSFLRYFCLNDDIISSLLKGASYRGRSKLGADNADDPIHVVTENFPDICDDAPFPPLWTRGTTLQSHIDVIMHLLYLGVTKTVTFLVRDWLKVGNSYQPFQKFAGKVLAKSFPRVSWCMPAPYTGEKLGGWVSENYLALARLACWFYGPLGAIVSTRTPEDVPVGPHNKWGVEQLRTWLVARGITVDNMVDPAFGAPEAVVEIAQVCIQEKRSMSIVKKRGY
jgi:hypothetical protein